MEAILQHSTNKTDWTVKMHIIFVRLFITAKGRKSKTILG